jgi:CHAP domain
VIGVTSVGACLAVVALPVGVAAAAPVIHPYAGGGVVPFGDAVDYGTLTTTLASAVTGMAATPDGKGYWLVGADGGVFAFGDAGFYGALGSLKLNGPIVAMASTPDGKGYWLVGLDGGVFAFGDAGFYGSMGATKLAQPIVGIATTTDGAGYWLVAADGGIFAFGDAGFYGSMGATKLAASVTGMAPTKDGGVFAFGDAGFDGSMGKKPPPASIAGIAATPDGGGYWMVGNDGSVYQFGDAVGYGEASTTKPISPVSAIVPTPDGKGYWLLEPDDWSYSFSAPSPYMLVPSAAITAVATSQVGPDPDNSEGSFCNPYGPCEAWCALFATWVWEQAGIAVPSIPFTGNMYTWAVAHGRIVPSTVLPAPGDALLYGTGPQSTATSVHTGLVVEVWPDGAVLTVEGDAGPAPSGQLSVIINGPFLPSDSANYNGVPVYAVAQPVH